jgi:hypothetical protein
MATAPQHIAATLADSIFGVGPKLATGEMSQEELDASGRQEWPLHYVIADILGGVVHPFDQYQGPYVEFPDEGRLFIYSEDGVEGAVFNEDTKESSAPFMLNGNDSETDAVNAALSVCEHPNDKMKDRTQSLSEVLSPEERSMPGYPEKNPDELQTTPQDEKWLKSINVRSHLNSPLDGKSASFSKTADGSMLGHDDQPSANSKLQQTMGDSLDQPISAFAQFYPNVGTMQMPNPLSPVEGDACFFTYMVPGAVFQSHDGQQWDVLDYNGGAYGVHIQNRWYPRLQAWVNLDDIRRSIHSWVEPVQVVVPPPPPGVNYIGQPVRIVDGKSHA